MPDRIKLSPRLEMCALLAGEGKGLLDVGTDHAYLPAELLLRNKFSIAVASDIVPGPCANARNTAAQYGLENRLQVVMAPGMEACDPEKTPVVTIAGMGGDMMASIITHPSAAKCHRLVLQPMTHEERVRRILRELHFPVTREILVTEQERLYLAMEVCPEIKMSSHEPEVPEEEIRDIVGRVLWDNDPALSNLYIQKKTEYYKKAAVGFMAAGKNREASRRMQTAEKLQKYADAYLQK